MKSELTLKEKERRWSLVRQSMKEEGLTAIVSFGDEHYHVPTRYLTDYFATGGSKQALFFPLEGDPVFLMAAPRNKYFAEKIGWFPPENIRSTNDWAGDLARLVIEHRLHKKRIGLDSFRTWPVWDYRVFRGLCPDAELMDAGWLLMRVRGPKSAEELKLMGEATALAEGAQRTFLAHLKPGMKEEEVVAPVEAFIRAHGCHLRIWHVSSTPEYPYPDIPGDIIIRRGNPVMFNSEFTRTCGYGVQVVRNYCWEEPRGLHKRIFELWGELRRLAEREFRTGAELTQVATKAEALADEWGFECNYMGHAVGLVHAESPSISSDLGSERYIQRSHGKEWIMRTNEVFCFHPMVRPKGGGAPFVWMAEMYRVGENGATWMTPFLPGLPEMIPG